MFRVAFYSLACAVLLVASSAEAGKTDAGQLLWQDQFDLAGGFDAALAVAAAHGRVVSVGRSMNGAGNTDFVVRTYDAKAGTLLWSDLVDVAGGDEVATSVVMDNDRVAVAGTTTDATGQVQQILRVYVAKNGRLAWAARTGASSGGGLAMGGTHIVISGTTTDANGDAHNLVRAYVVGTGVLAWQDHAIPAGFGRMYAAGRSGVAIQGKWAFVASGLLKPVADPDPEPRCLVRAYELKTGRIRWQSDHATICRPMATATDGRTVVLAALAGLSLDDFFAQAYDADTGGFLWENRTFVPTGTDNEAVAVDIERRRAFVAGWVLNHPPALEAFLVRAYEADTGRIDWEDQYLGIGAGSCVFHARDLTADKKRVFTVGAGFCFPDEGWIVRVYDAKRGDLLWSDNFRPTGGLDPYIYGDTGALGVAFDAGRLFVVGSGINAQGNSDFILRAYDAK